MDLKIEILDNHLSRISDIPKKDLFDKVKIGGYKYTTMYYEDHPKKSIIYPIVDKLSRKIEFDLRKRHFLNRYWKGKNGKNQLILESIFGKGRMEVDIFNGDIL
jgi:hypothetical protein